MPLVAVTASDDRRQPAVNIEYRNYTVTDNLTWQRGATASRWAAW